MSDFTHSMKKSFQILRKNLKEFERVIIYAHTRKINKSNKKSNVYEINNFFNIGILLDSL